MKLRVLLVDDEPLARERLRMLLAEDGAVEIAGEAADGEAAVEFIRAHHPDVVLLDIQMPGLDGFGVLRELGREELPLVILVTAFDQHAVKAFEAHALDYLLKPCKPARLREAIQRAREQLQSRSAQDVSQRLVDLLAEQRPKTPHLTRLAVKHAERVVFVKASQIDWIEASGNYVVLHAGKESHIIRETIGTLDGQLAPDMFLRISRSAIVNLDRVKELQSLGAGEHVVILHDGRKLAMTRGLREVEEKLKFG